MTFLRTRKPIPSEGVDVLLRHLAEPDRNFVRRFADRVGPVGPQKEAFEKKYVLYLLALNMVCLVAREREDDRFAAIRKRFEKEVVFPMFRNENELKSFTAAMREIANLEKPVTEAKPLTWASGWFSGVGVEITNFVVLGQFVVLWQQRLYYTLKLLIDIGKKY